MAFLWDSPPLVSNFECLTLILLSIYYLAGRVILSEYSLIMSIMKLKICRNLEFLSRACRVFVNLISFLHFQPLLPTSWFPACSDCAEVPYPQCVTPFYISQCSVSQCSSQPLLIYQFCDLKKILWKIIKALSLQWNFFLKVKYIEVTIVSKAT